jgi:hypothetical protein
VWIPALLLAVVLAACAELAGPPPQPPMPSGLVYLPLDQSAASLARIATEDDLVSDLERRREILVDLNRGVLMAPPSDAIVPELFDFTALLAARMESGAVSSDWAAYLYTSYQRDLVRERPDGTPRRSAPAIEASLAESIEFYRIQKRGDAPPPAGVWPPPGDDGRAGRSW